MELSHAVVGHSGGPIAQPAGSTSMDAANTSQSGLPQEESSSLPHHISHQRAGLAPMQMRSCLALQGRFEYDHDDGDCITWKRSTLDEIGVKHFIGKSGRHLWRLETLTSNLIGLVDSKNGGVYVHIYGSCDGIIIVLHVLE